ncbi:MAG TPA: hypothetical protein VMF13_04000, partial [Luteitalea sp.]|nr:hypothetical protein [Luteitalea sp.]
MRMRTVVHALVVATTVACLGGVVPAQVTQKPSTHRQLLIVVDGLRPDLVTGDVMPRLTALGKRGAV